MMVFEVEHLRKYYGKQRGVEDVTFSMEEGEIFGFIGPNGAGKSTTLRCALGLIFPDQGTIRLFRRDAIRERAALAESVGYLPGEVFYYDHMRVKDLLRYAASFYKRDLAQRTKMLCEWMELDPNKKISELSLGNRKKVGIVQGLLHEPKLILLDEPTSGLDPLMQQRFFELITKEREHGTSILFSSHILSEVRRLCDRIAILREGRVVDLQRMEHLSKNNYKKIVMQGEEEVLMSLQEEKFGVLQEHSLGERTFLFRGDINGLLRELSQIMLQNLSIEEPSLEEIFMHYYERDLS